MLNLYLNRIKKSVEDKEDLEYYIKGNSMILNYIHRKYQKQNGGGVIDRLLHDANNKLDTIDPLMMVNKVDESLAIINTIYKLINFISIDETGQLTTLKAQLGTIEQILRDRQTTPL